MEQTAAVCPQELEEQGFSANGSPSLLRLDTKKTLIQFSPVCSSNFSLLGLPLSPWPWMSRCESGTYLLVPLPPSTKTTFYLCLPFWHGHHQSLLREDCCPVRPQFCSVLHGCTSAAEEPLLIAMPTLLIATVRSSSSWCPVLGGKAEALLWSRLEGVDLADWILPSFPQFFSSWSQRRNSSCILSLF